jgi:protein-histidine pros-kinase
VGGDPDANEERRRHLERMGYQVMVAGDGDEAVRLAVRERPSVVVADHALTGPDPAELLRRLRDDAATASCAVVVTARDRDVDERFWGAALEGPQRSHERFRALLEAAPTAIIIVDAEGRIELVNEEAERLFGWPREALVGQPGTMLVPERHRPQLRELRRAVMRSPRRHHVTGSEFRGVHADGSEFPAELLVSPLDDAARPAICAVVRDLTARKEAEEAQLTAYEREREASARLREVDRLRSDFLSTVSHELRTPLTAIRGFSEWLVDSWEVTPDAQRLEIVRRMLRAGSRLDDLIQDLLDFSRLERGQLRVDLTPHELTALVRRTLDDVASSLEQHHVALELDDSLWVLADRPVFGRALENLLTNAAKFSAPGSTIHVRTEAAPGGAVVVVRDEGVGIPDVEHAKVFDRFYRVPETATHHPGTGIGLAIVKQFVEAQGGWVTLRSEPGRGTEFTIHLQGADR